MLLAALQRGHGPRLAIHWPLSAIIHTTKLEGTVHANLHADFMIDLEMPIHEITVDTLP